MQHGNYRFGHTGATPFDHLNSNTNDSDIKRDFPTFASPYNKYNTERKPAPEEEIPQGLTVKQKNALAAEKDPILAKRPDVRPLFPGSSDYEPIDHSGKVFKSPVFLVDPKFTKDLPKEEKTLFTDNDHGGWKQPVSQSAWPLISDEVQSFFGVGPDCTCKDHEKEVIFKTPRYEPLRLPDYYEPVLEPQYEYGEYKMARLNQHTCYRGDDFGGHNIPFPHPRPPTPDAYYTDCFIDLTRVYDGVTDGYAGHGFRDQIHYHGHGDRSYGYGNAGAVGDLLYGGKNDYGYGSDPYYGPYEADYYDAPYNAPYDNSYDNDYGNFGGSSSYGKGTPSFARW